MFEGQCGIQHSNIQAARFWTSGRRHLIRQGRALADMNWFPTAVETRYSAPFPIGIPVWQITVLMRVTRVLLGVSAFLAVLLFGPGDSFTLAAPPTVAQFSGNTAIVAKFGRRIQTRLLSWASLLFHRLGRGGSLGQVLAEGLLGWGRLSA